MVGGMPLAPAWRCKSITSAPLLQRGHGHGRQGVSSRRSFGVVCCCVVSAVVLTSRWLPSEHRNTFLPAPKSPGHFVAPHFGHVLGAAAVAAFELPRAALAQAPIYTAEGGWKNPGQGIQTDASLAPDLFYYVYLIATTVLLAASFYLLTRGYFETRLLQEKINAKKLKFIAGKEYVNAIDRYELARLYNQLQDFPAALGEFEEVEDEWPDTREAFDPEDAMGALAARAMMHNSKGYALAMLQPPRVAQARKEFVRAVTFWPEYPEALLNIGRELIKRKRYDVAIRTLDAALKWQPASEYIMDAAQLAKRMMEDEEEQERAYEEEAAKDEAEKQQAIKDKAEGKATPLSLAEKATAEKEKATEEKVPA